MADKSGTYFKDIYADIVKQLPQFPTDDPSPNLQECIRDNYVNFVRAERLAKGHNLAPEIVKHLQELAILQYLVDFGNREGLLELGHEFNFSRDERVRLIQLIMKESVYPCFSFSRRTEMAADNNWGSDWKELYVINAEDFMKGR
jgi:hypothetical protein